MNQRWATVRVGGVRARDTSAASTLAELFDQQLVALGQRTIEQRIVVECQQVEGDERRRRLGGESADAGFGGMDALQQRVEVEPAIIGGRHDDLAVDDASLRQRRKQRFEQLGEVAGERALVAAGELDLVAVAEDDAAEAVPLRLVQPAIAGRECRSTTWRASATAAAEWEASSRTLSLPGSRQAV